MGILVAKKVDEETDETLTWLSCSSIPYLGCRCKFFLPLSCTQNNPPLVQRLILIP